MRDDWDRLRSIVKRGPFLRGTPEWEDRELARMALGNRCLSFGEITPRSTRKVNYHYMIPKDK